jgi:hypothetical protein
MSQRKIAQAVGVSKKQVWRDLGGAKGAENGAKRATSAQQPAKRFYPCLPTRAAAVVKTRQES